MFKFLKENWKAIAAIGAIVVSYFVPTVALPVLATTGGLIVGSYMLNVFGKLFSSKTTPSVKAPQTIETHQAPSDEEVISALSSIAKINTSLDAASPVVERAASPVALVVERAASPVSPVGERAASPVSPVGERAASPVSPVVERAASPASLARQDSSESLTAAPAF